MKNFEKPIQDFTDEELLEKVNVWDPRYGIIASYELQRRIALENTQSSKRFAKWSLTIAVVAILISLLTSI